MANQCIVIYVDTYLVLKQIYTLGLTLISKELIAVICLVKMRVQIDEKMYRYIEVGRYNHQMK